MLYRILADIIVLVHLVVILFIVVGGLLCVKWPKAAFVHLPFAVWGVAIETLGFICPLTPLENHLRLAAGDAGYSGGFVEHYVIPIVYPAGLTQALQWLLAGVVIVVNAAIYTWIIVRWRAARG
jgi:hypothetical protein